MLITISSRAKKLVAWRWAIEKGASEYHLPQPARWLTYVLM